MIILCVSSKFFENRRIVEMLCGILCVPKAKDVMQRLQLKTHITVTNTP